MTDQKLCLSTHGGAGYPPGTIISANGEAICPLCGAKMIINEYAIGQHVTDNRIKILDAGIDK